MTAQSRAAAVAALAFCGLVPAEAADKRAAADIRCTPAKALVYDCTITLREARSGEPLSGASVTVNADMSSMPMAHNPRPVTAVPGREPGAYQARIALDMLGDWAVRIDVAGPMRDRIVRVLRFEEASVAPPPRTPPAGR